MLFLLILCCVVYPGISKPLDQEAGKSYESSSKIFLRQFLKGEHTNNYNSHFNHHQYYPFTVDLLNIRYGYLYYWMICEQLCFTSIYNYIVFYFPFLFIIFKIRNTTDGFRLLILLVCLWFHRFIKICAHLLKI